MTTRIIVCGNKETPVVIAFWNGTSRGTKNMIEQVRKAGAEVNSVPITL